MFSGVLERFENSLALRQASMQVVPIIHTDVSHLCVTLCSSTAIFVELVRFRAGVMTSIYQEIWRFDDYPEFVNSWDGNQWDAGSLVEMEKMVVWNYDNLPS